MVTTRALPGFDGFDDPTTVYRGCPTTGCMALVPYQILGGICAVPGPCSECGAGQAETQPARADVVARLARVLGHAFAIALPRRARRGRSRETNRYRERGALS